MLPPMSSLERSQGTGFFGLRSQSRFPVSNAGARNDNRLHALSRYLTVLANCLLLIVALHHTRHARSLTIFCPAWQLNALAKSSLFCITPFTRNWPGECG